MIWLVVVYLFTYDGDKIRTALEKEYATHSDCQEAKEFVKERVADYWPNPEANVKKIEVICITERPNGN